MRLECSSLPFGSTLELDPNLDFFFGGLAEGPGALGLGAKSWEGVGIMASKS